MARIKLDPREYPLKEGESWWLIHPNYSKCELRLPIGGVTVCTEELIIDHSIGVFNFNFGVAYDIVGADNTNGWVIMSTLGITIEMPQYLFTRHFDAEAFIVGTPTKQEQALLEDYWEDDKTYVASDFVTISNVTKEQFEKAREKILEKPTSAVEGDPSKKRKGGLIPPGSPSSSDPFAKSISDSLESYCSKKFPSSSSSSSSGGNKRKEVYTSEEDEHLWKGIVISTP